MTEVCDLVQVDVDRKEMRASRRLRRSRRSRRTLRNCRGLPAEQES